MAPLLVTDWVTPATLMVPSLRFTSVADRILETDTEALAPEAETLIAAPLPDRLTPSSVTPETLVDVPLVISAWLVDV